MSPLNRPDRFHMEPDVDPRGRLAVEQLLGNDTCRAVDYRRSTASTNSLALADLAQPGPAPLPCPKLYLADQQTAGRGRHGRRWVSSDATLTFSLIVPHPGTQQRAGQILPLAVGVGIARYLEFELAPLQVRLKWPNDLHVGGGKVAGILMETPSTRPDRVVIGVGLNVGHAPQLESAPETQSARGLAQVLGRSLQRYDLLDGVVTHILESIQDSETDIDQTLDDFRKRCLLAGNLVSFQQSNKACEGHCRGISDQGALLVETEHGLCHLHSGEANLIRPRPTRT